MINLNKNTMFKKIHNFFLSKKTSHKEKMISGAIVFSYIFSCGLFSDHLPSKWYESLLKPDYIPDDFIFLVIWICLFVLIAMSGYLVWNFYESKIKRNIFALLYVLNGILIYLWSYYFFGLHDLFNTLYVSVGVIIVAELMILTAFGKNKKASYLLIPYLAWVLYETYLITNLITLNLG